MNKKFKKSKIDWTSLIIQSILDLAVGLIDYREAYIASPLTHYNLFIVYYASKIRNIFYRNWNCKIHLCNVFKTQRRIT